MEFDHRYASKGQGNAGVVGAALGGTALLGALSNGGGCGNNGGILGNLFGGGHNDCYVNQKENDLSIALAISESEKYASEKNSSQLERLFAEIRREDDKLETLTASVASGVIATSKEIGILQADVKCLQREVDRNREEGRRDLRESKEYTDTKVHAEAQLRACADNNIEAWTTGQLATKINAVQRIDPSQICGPSPLAGVAPVAAPIDPYCCN